MLVHVIKPSGTRFEMRFSDTESDAKILEALDANKMRFGFNGTVRKKDPNVPAGAPDVDFSDETSGFVFDHPDTAVAVLKTTGSGREAVAVVDGKGVPVELRRLKGPALVPVQ